MSDAQPARNIPRGFCSHRSVDKPRFCEVARKLREAGIDAWLDEWAIKPGEQIVEGMNRGLSSYDVGLIFFSNEVEHGKWMQAEISAIAQRADEDGIPVIRVMLDPDVPLPPLLRPLPHVRFDQVDSLIDTIFGRTPRPPLKTQPPLPASGVC